MKARMILSLASVSVASILSAAAHAQATAAAGPVADQQSEPALTGDIIVTAQKRSQRLLDVGLSITAATGLQLEQRGITTVEGLSRLEPSLQYSSSYSGAPVYTIRGAGFFEQGIASPPAVSLYQDEIAFAYPILSAGALLDVQRVEVLKGPQGILYGQNATGGAVNFIANRPTSEFSAGVNASYGRFGAAEFNGFISGPLSETLGVRISAKTEQGGAWQRSNTRDDELGDRNFWAGRILTDWEPSDSFRASLNLNAWHDKSETQAGQLSGIWLGVPGVVSPLTPDANIPTAENIANRVYPADVQAVVENPISPHDNRAADWVAGTHPNRNQKFMQASLRLDKDFSEAIGITSLTGFQHFTADDLFDISGVNTFNLRQTTDGKIDAFSQELRLHGVILDGKLDWLLGANYAHDKSDFHYRNFNRGASNSFLTNPPFDIGEQTIRQTTESKAVFANLSYEITDQFKITGGARYTESKLTNRGCLFTYDTNLQALFTSSLPLGSCLTRLFDGSLGSYTVRLKENNIPWRIALDWKITPSALLYAVVSKGYKAGAAPTLLATAETQINPARQESIQSYEIGFKGEFLDRRLSLTAAAFHYDYSNKQFLGRIIDPLFGPLPSLLNVPKSKEDGAELSLVWRADGLTLDVNGTYLDSRVKSDFANFNVYGQAVNFKGERFPFAPKFSGNAGVRYEFTMGDVQPFVSVRGSYQTRTASAFGDATAIASGYPSVGNKAYALLDMSAGLESADHRFRFEIWGRNITNTYYWNTVNYNFDTVARLTGKPATFGITLGYKFGAF